MKLFLKISIFLLLLSACKEPSVTGPGDKTVDDIIEYEIIASSDQGIEADSISEYIIESKAELSKFIYNKSDGLNLRFIDELLTLDLEQKTLVVITYRTVYSNSSINIDSLYINNSGSVGLDYTVVEEGERQNRVKYLSLALLVNKRIKQNLIFRKRIERRYDNNFNGFRTIAKNMTVDYKFKWKEVFNSEIEFRIWAAKVKLSDLSLLDSVNFDTQTLISVGTGYFTSGNYDYTITDIQSTLNSLLVKSEFTVIDHMTDVFKPANHFVVTNKTNKQIRFTPSRINQNDALNRQNLYFEDFRSIKVKTHANMADSLTITKARNVTELFSALSLSNELNPATLLIDFEFFDVIVLKTGPIPAKVLNIEVQELREINGLLTGQINLRILPNQGVEFGNFINIIKVIKTDTELDSNFKMRIL